MTLTKRPKIFVEEAMPLNPKVLDLSSDSARYALVVLWCKAKKHSGSFVSERQLKEDMAARYKYVAELRRQGFLDGLDVHDWPDHQVDKDPTGASRQKALRERRRNGESNGESNAPDRYVTPPEQELELEQELEPEEVRISLPNGSSPRRGGLVAEAWGHYQRGTGRLLHRGPTDAEAKLIRAREKTFGKDVVIAACYGHRYDDWENRPKNIQPEDIWRKGNIERFAEWQDHGGAPQVPRAEEAWMNDFAMEGAS